MSDPSRSPSAPSPPVRTASPALRILRAAVADLRRTAPEARAVLAGLVLVLGAWVVPGLPDTPAASVALAGAPRSASQAMEAGTRGGDAYRAAVRAAAVDEERGPEEKPQKAEDDQD